MFISRWDNKCFNAFKNEQQKFFYFRRLIETHESQICLSIVFINVFWSTYICECKTVQLLNQNCIEQANIAGTNNELLNEKLKKKSLFLKKTFFLNKFTLKKKTFLKLVEN